MSARTVVKRYSLPNNTRDLQVLVELDRGITLNMNLQNSGSNAAQPGGGRDAFFYSPHAATGQVDG